MPENYTEMRIRQLADAMKPEDRPEFVVVDHPTRCQEYISEGLGDSDCGHLLERLSKHVSRCPNCRAVYISKSITSA
jgi:predicted Zn-ribbon and HTH transcriptional regulator